MIICGEYLFDDRALRSKVIKVSMGLWGNKEGAGVGGNEG
jgi:hypothetical protein